MSLVLTVSQSAVVDGQAMIPVQAGFPVTLGETPTNPVVADLVSGSPGLEVVSCSYGISVFLSSGALAVGWPAGLLSWGVLPIQIEAPVVGDVDGDGELELVYWAGFSHALVALDAAGNIEPGWPVAFGSNQADNSMRTLALGDVDGDGVDDVVFPGRERVIPPALHSVFAYRGNGQPVPGWPAVVDLSTYVNLNTVDSDQYYNLGLAVGDLELDGSSEVVISFNLYTAGFQSLGSVLAVIDSDGTPRAGWPRLVNNGRQCYHPIIADLDGDGVAEILGGDGTIYAYRADGSVFFLPTAGGSSAPMAVGDLDGDGDLEIVAGGDSLRVISVTQTGINHYAQVTAQSPPIFDNLRCLTIADFDGDGVCEIGGYDGSDGYPCHAHMLDSQTLLPAHGWPIDLPGLGGVSQYFAGAAVGDLDQDGDLELVQPHGHDVQVWDVPNSFGGPLRIEWASMGHDAARSFWAHRGEVSVPRFLRGDVDRSGTVSLLDAVGLLSYLFGSAGSNCVAQLDITDDGAVNLIDPVNLLAYLFLGGTAPSAPFPTCSAAPGSTLDCQTLACP